VYIYFSNLTMTATMSIIQPVLILTLTCLQLVATSYATEDEAGSQYLAFNGTISANRVLPTETDNKYCSQQALGPFAQSYIYVGVNPPWDNNPFFFELYHLTSGLNSGVSPSPMTASTTLTLQQQHMRVGQTMEHPVGS